MLDLHTGNQNSVQFVLCPGNSVEVFRSPFLPARIEQFDFDAFCNDEECSNKEDPDSHRFIIDWIEYERL